MEFKIYHLYKVQKQVINSIHTQLFYITGASHTYHCSQANLSIIFISVKERDKRDKQTDRKERKRPQHNSAIHGASLVQYAGMQGSNLGPQSTLTKVHAVCTRWTIFQSSKWYIFK